MANYTQASATKQIKVGAGKLKGILVSSTSSGTLAVYDNGAATAAGVMINTITPAAATNLIFPDGIWFNNGLYVVAANTIEFTVVWE